MQMCSAFCSPVPNVRLCLLMQETWVLALDQGDPLEKEMATYSSIPAWKIPWTEEPRGLQSMADMTEYTCHATNLFIIFAAHQIFAVSCRIFPCGSVVNPPAMQEMQVPSLGNEGPLEEGMATHSSIPAWKIPWTEEPGGLQSMGA